MKPGRINMGKRRSTREACLDKVPESSCFVGSLHMTRMLFFCTYFKMMGKTFDTVIHEDDYSSFHWFWPTLQRVRNCSTLINERKENLWSAAIKKAASPLAWLLTSITSIKSSVTSVSLCALHLAPSDFYVCLQGGVLSRHPAQSFIS